MKSKTTIICILLFTSISFSQNLQVFDSFEVFQTAITNNCSSIELTFEGFDNIVTVPSCNVPVLPDPNQECFTPDELEDGFTIQVLNQTNMSARAQGAFGGSPINFVFPNSFSETVLIDFNPSAAAVSFSTWEIGAGISDQGEVYGESNQLLGAFIREKSGQGLYAFHVISDDPISRIETRPIP